MAISSTSAVRNRMLVRLLVLGWAITAVLGAADVWRSGGSLFFIAASMAVGVYLVRALFELYPGRPAIELVAAMVLVALVVGVPLGFDTRTGDVFNLTKYTVVIIGTLVLAALVGIEWIRSKRPILLRNGLHWPVIALVAWTFLVTLTSVDMRVSLLGFYKSYDGLFAALALALFFFLAVHLLTINNARIILSVLYFGAGGLAVLYGIMQLHDRTFGGAHWDWVNWGSAAFVGSSIWATFGNPNHFAGFLAILLPIGIVLLFVYRRPYVRALVGAITICLILELLQTTTRGAWLAALVSVPMIVAFLWPEFKARPLISLPIAGLLVVAVVAAVVILGPTRSFGEAIKSMFQFGTSSSAEQRVELWQSAWHMGLDRPVFGYGPDTFRIEFPRYQSARFVKLYGPDQIANGPHNTFMNYLASSGFPGLALFLALIACAGARAAGAWRRLRKVERDGKLKDKVPARNARYLLAGAMASATAYLIQGSFNVQQVALTFCFWTLVAVVTAIALDAGVPETLDIRRIVRADEIAELAAPPGTPIARDEDDQTWLRVAAARLALASKDPRDRSTRRSQVAIATGLAITLVAVAAFEISRPYRADLSYFRGLREQARGQTTGLSKFSSTARKQFARRDYLQAAGMNPWEPLYLQEAAIVDFDLAQTDLENSKGKTSADGLQLLQKARHLYARAVALQPENPYVQEGYARTLVAIGQVDPNATYANDDAIVALRAAVDSNPWQPSFPLLLSALLANEGKLQDSLDVVTYALAYAPTNTDLLQRATEIAGALGQTDEAHSFSERLAALGGTSTTTTDSVTPQATATP